MYCTECGKEMKQGSKFCSYCGKKIECDSSQEEISIFDRLLQSVTPEEKLLLECRERVLTGEETKGESLDVFEMAESTQKVNLEEQYGAKIKVVNHIIWINKGWDMINDIKKKLMTECERLAKEFSKKYIKIVETNNKDMVENCINLYMEYINKIVDFAISSARKYQIVLEKDVFITELYSEYFDLLEQIMPFLEGYMKIAQTYGVDEAIREMKVLTTGNWIGGGRSISGAILGSITAKVMNAATKYSVDVALKAKNQIAMRKSLQQLMYSEAECFVDSFEECGKSIIKVLLLEIPFQGVDIEHPKFAKITVTSYQDRLLEQVIFGKIKQILKAPASEVGYYALFDSLQKYGLNIKEAKEITQYFGMEYCMERYLEK